MVSYGDYEIFLQETLVAVSYGVSEIYYETGDGHVSLDVHENLNVVSYGIYEFFYGWLVVLVKCDSFTIYEPFIVTGFIGKDRYFISYTHVSVWPDLVSAGACAISHETSD